MLFSAECLLGLATIKNLIVNFSKINDQSIVIFGKKIIYRANRAKRTNVFQLSTKA